LIDCLADWLYDLEWCRSVVKSGGQGQSGQAITLFHITLYVNDFQTLNNPGSFQSADASKY